MGEPMRIVLLGTGTPDPRPQRAGSSTYVGVGDAGVVFDLGPGATRNLALAGIDPISIGHVFFTHLHFDHSADYAHFMLSRWDQGAGAADELSVYGPSPIARMTERLFGRDGAFEPDLLARVNHPMSQQAFRNRGGVMPRGLPQISVQELRIGDVVKTKGWVVRTAHAQHAQPYLTSLAYRIDTQAGSVVISGDTKPLPGMAEFARDAHTLVHMAMEVDAARGRWPDIYAACTSAHGAGKIAAAAGVDRLVLVHVSIEADEPAYAAAMVSEANEVFDGEVFVGTDGLQLMVPGSRQQRLRPQKPNPHPV